MQQKFSNHEEYIVITYDEFLLKANMVIVRQISKIAILHMTRGIVRWSYVILPQHPTTTGEIIFPFHSHG